MVALALVGDSAARLFARETRTRRGAYFFIDIDSPCDREPERRTRGEVFARVDLCDAGRVRGRARAATTWQKSHSGRGERNRHHARAGRLGLDVNEGFHDRRRTGDAS